MKQPFNFSEFIQPIKVAEKEPEDGAEALISGWGLALVKLNFTKKISFIAFIKLF